MRLMTSILGLKNRFLYPFDWIMGERLLPLEYKTNDLHFRGGNTILYTFNLFLSKRLSCLSLLFLKLIMSCISDKRLLCLGVLFCTWLLPYRSQVGGMRVARYGGGATFIPNDFHASYTGTIFKGDGLQMTDLPTA